MMMMTHIRYSFSIRLSTNQKVINGDKNVYIPQMTLTCKCVNFTLDIVSNYSSSRLVFATTSPAEAVPAGLSAYVNVVEFVQSREGLEEMFLDRFLRLEKPRMQETRTQVITVYNKYSRLSYIMLKKLSIMLFCVTLKTEYYTQNYAQL